MILYIKHYEQLCNRLWAILPSIAYALHYKKKIVMFWALKQYMDLFPNLRQCPYLKSYCETETFAYRRSIHRIWKWYEKTLMTRKLYRDISPKVPVIFSSGFTGREDPSYVVEVKDQLIELFKPQQSVVDLVGTKIVKDTDVCYVGVHIRRGDYKDFFQGIFYYEIDYFYKLMDLLYQQLRKEGKKVKFVICSNEKFDICDSSLLDKVSFRKENLLRFENANAITDLYALSQCDLLMGPPSTFSMWATFYGEGKLFMIKKKDITSLSMEDFKPVVSFESPFKEFRQFWKGQIP